MAEREIVGMYLGMTAKKRMDFIYKNYRNFNYISDAYMDSVTEMIACIRECERRHEEDDLGVRVQTSQSLSSITEQRAFEHILIKEALDNNLITDSLIEDAEERERVSVAIFEWNLMKSEYEIFNKQMKALKPENYEIVKEYISRRKSIGDLADEYNIEPESMKVRLHRIKGILIDGIIPFLKDYEFNRKLMQVG